jgi:hypothetical protein
MTTTDGYTGLLPSKNSEIHLVRWVRKDGEWSAETLFVTYKGLTGDHWAVRSHRTEMLLPCDEWQIFAV